MDHENLRIILPSRARALARSLAAAGPVLVAVVACGSHTDVVYPADDHGVKVTVQLGEGWSGMEPVDHVSIIATSPDRTAVVCFGATGDTLGAPPTADTGNTVDPCADEPALASTGTPAMASLRLYTHGSITADLGFPDGSPVTVTAFVALAGGALVGQIASSATTTGTAKAGLDELSLTLANQSVAPAAACVGLAYTPPPTATTPTPCGTAETCVDVTDLTGMGEHDFRTHCLSGSDGGFLVEGTSSTCATPNPAWRDGKEATCGELEVKLAFYACVPEGGADDAGVGCLRTAACTPPSVILSTLSAGRAPTDEHLIDLGACVVPSVYSLSVAMNLTMGGVGTDLSVTPQPAVNGLPPCDVEVDVLQIDNSRCK
jgi:hypothetical protein